MGRIPTKSRIRNNLILKLLAYFPNHALKAKLFRSSRDLLCELLRSLHKIHHHYSFPAENLLSGPSG